MKEKTTKKEKRKKQKGKKQKRATVIFGKMYFLLISQSELFREIKRDEITSLHGIHNVYHYIINFQCHNLI